MLIPQALQKHLKFNFIVYKFLKRKGYSIKEGGKGQNTSERWRVEADSRREAVVKTTIKMSLEQRKIKFSQSYVHNRYNLK